MARRWFFSCGGTGTEKFLIDYFRSGLWEENIFVLG